MSSRSGGPASRPVAIALCLMLSCVAVAVVCAATAHAADYKMVLCAGNNGSNSFDTATNTASPQNPGGIFSFENYCGPAPGPGRQQRLPADRREPAGGNAGDNAYGSISWTAPPWVAILAGGGYTREPNAFNEGWRGPLLGRRLRRLDQQHPHAGHRRRQRQPRRDRLGDDLDLRLPPLALRRLRRLPALRLRADLLPPGRLRPHQLQRRRRQHHRPHPRRRLAGPRLHLTNTGAPLLAGEWVRGTQAVTCNWSNDQGSGLRLERIDIDGAGASRSTTRQRRMRHRLLAGQRRVRPRLPALRDRPRPSAAPTPSTPPASPTAPTPCGPAPRTTRQ